MADLRSPAATPPMDRARARLRSPRQIGLGALGLAVVGAAVVWRVYDGATVPTVRLADVLTDTVARGDLRIEVRATGTLVPERIRFLTAQTSARVDRLLRQDGAEVRTGDLLLTLSNPDVPLRALEADQRLGQSKQALLALSASLDLQVLAQESLVAGLVTQRAAAVQSRQIADSLRSRGFMSTVEATNAAALATETTTRERLERERLHIMRESIGAQITAQRQQVTQLGAIARTQRERVKSLDVRAPEDGVMQDFSLQPGQWVPEGSALARIVNPNELKAVLRVAESEASAVQSGQPVLVDTRNGFLHGRVLRKATSAQSGVIPVEVTLTPPLPPGAVPDLGVDGAIQIDVRRDVLSISRPPSAAAFASGTVFRLTADGRWADRVRVSYGKSSADRIEVREGLRVGDRVIIGDRPEFAAVARVALH